MTTLVAVVTQDSIVMGSDTLGTESRQLLSPGVLMKYFDPHAEGGLALDEDGKSLLHDFRQMFDETRDTPYNQVADVEKLIDLRPLPMGVMYAGVTSVGSRTVRDLIRDFKRRDPAFSDTNIQKNYKYTVNRVGSRLLAHLKLAYDKVYDQGFFRPALKLMLAGFDRDSPEPRLFRLYVHADHMLEAGPGPNMYFAGQFDWIQRVVHGTDTDNVTRLEQRHESLLRAYASQVRQAIDDQGVENEIPDTPIASDSGRLFGDDWHLNGLDAPWSSFTTQTAIDAVDFFIEMMIRVQSFSSRLPTVGGPIQVGVITGSSGFTWVSLREWRHGDSAVEIPE